MAMFVAVLLAVVSIAWSWGDVTHTPRGGQSCTALTTDQITSAGNNTLFTRWRPRSHFIAPAGWSNDPCGAMYDAQRDTYHLFYQWHPEHISWGNVSWGHATSKDLISWTDDHGWEGLDAQALGPTGNGSYNGLGIFSGTAQPVNLHGVADGTLVLMYTSVKYLPTSWSTYYHPHTESQSLAVSHDGGRTFQEHAGNPVIDATTGTAPMFWNLTGFRDPFLEPIPALDEVLGASEPHYYAVFGSGIKGVGPRIPLWTAPASDLTDWKFLGALWEPHDNSSLGPVLSTGSYGFNFEVSGFFPLPDRKGNLHWFVNMGTEGGNGSFHESVHWALWNQGTVTRRSNGSVEFTPIAGGAADWGLAYALTSFNDTKHNRRVQFGWAPEDIVGDGGIFSARAQGFQGSLTLPRQLFVHEVDHVIGTTTLASNKNAVLTQHEAGTYTAQTLGVRPLPDVVAGLRKHASTKSFGTATYRKTTFLATAGSAHMELTMNLTSATGAAGLLIAAAPDMSEYTTIAYEPTNHTVLVDRSRSSGAVVGFNNATVTGYFYPYTLAVEPHAYGSASSAGRQEPIVMNVFVDGSLVEVYINHRFAMATRIYPSKACSTGFGVYVGTGSSATVHGVQAWLGTVDAWPDRPANSSSKLVFDTAAETNNYTWWAGD